MSFDIVILGLSVTSSWGNGHATTYRGLLKGLAARGHSVLFLGRDQPWYRDNRDEPHRAGGVTKIYTSVSELQSCYAQPVREAGLVILGSFVPGGIEVGRWILSIAQGPVAFYDIDTPLTLSKMEKGGAEYIDADLIGQYDAYFSFTGGPILRRLERDYESPMVRVLYCSADAEHYRPVRAKPRWDLGNLGTFSEDRQPGLDALLLDAGPAVAGGALRGVWSGISENHPLAEECRSPDPFIAARACRVYAAQRFGLNLTRAAMKVAGYSPNVRLFEAAACGIPLISDWWEGLERS